MMITSTSNPQVKWLVQLQKKSKSRNEEGLFVAEGLRMFLEMPKERLKSLYVSESFYARHSKELSLEKSGAEILSDRVYGYVSDTKTPQGVLCVIKRKEYHLEDILSVPAPFLLVLDKLQDPGNLGTIVRTAEGAGVQGILMSDDCADLYNPKTIRSTMGSIYRMPVVQTADLGGEVDKLKQAGVRTYAAHLFGEHSYEEENYRTGTAFFIGNEGNGLRDEIAKRADARIKIPMHGQVESLNAAIAASVLMFEVCRQRR